MNASANSATPIIRVGIVDAHPATVVGAAAMINIQGGLHVAAAASTVRDLLAQSVRLDVVLLDLTLSDPVRMASGIRALTARGAHVIAFTSIEHLVFLPHAVRAGVIGAVRKSEGAEALAAAIRAAAAGEVRLTIEDFEAEDPPLLVRAELTAREAEILALYSSGSTADAVAEALFIARNTVLDHVRNIRAKYKALGRDVASKSALYQRAVEDGIVGDAN